MADVGSIGLEGSGYCCQWGVRHLFVRPSTPPGKVCACAAGDSFESYDGVERPPQPYNLTVHPYRNSLLLHWQSRPPPVAEAHADARHLRRPPDYYVVQYRTVGQWVPLAERVVGRTLYNWTTASRGAVYHFRVIAFYDAPPAGHHFHPRLLTCMLTFYAYCLHLQLWQFL